MWLRLVETLHGHFGILAAVALVHPAILLRRGAPLSRGARWSVALTTVVVASAFGLGISIYDAYRETVKRELFTRSFATGLAFETKEHLAFVVIALAVGGAAAALLAPPRAIELRRAAALVYAAAALTCFAVAGLGSVVASTLGF